MIGRQYQLESHSLTAFDPPARLYRPKAWTVPLVFASPHSGDIYPSSFLARSDLPLRDMRRNEDVFIDKLFKPATAWGAPLLAARFPRCYVDVNRAPDELPVEWRETTEPGTARAENGLGIIPTVIGEGMPIYKKPLTYRLARKRIEALYHPYHDLLSNLLNTAQETFGQALLVDCHSMPGFTLQGTRRPDIILGDRYGVSCHSETVEFVRGLFTNRGYSVTKNYPYAGGYVASHYGRPMEGIEVIQIEINRDLYVNPITYRPKRGYERLAQDIHDITGALAHRFDTSGLMAAE